MLNKLILSFALVTGLLSCSYAENPVYATADLSATEEANLLWMVEEEKLASDVYKELYELWGLQIFNNIGAKSELQHVEAVSYLLQAYGIENPSPSARGEFSNPDLQALYDDLLARGAESLEQALNVGVSIEKQDIMDLQKAINETQRADIIQVYQNLMKGSENHLEAFTRQLESRY